jgi:hypothetical protein
MSKKDYEFIASVIRNWANEPGHPGAAVRDSIARAFASELLNTNPRFDLKRFVNACVREKVQ